MKSKWDMKCVEGGYLFTQTIGKVRRQFRRARNDGWDYTSAKEFCGYLNSR